jgi:hypothetical protein
MTYEISMERFLSSTRLVMWHMRFMSLLTVSYIVKYLCRRLKYSTVFGCLILAMDFGHCLFCLGNQRSSRLRSCPFYGPHSFSCHRRIVLALSPPLLILVVAARRIVTGFIPSSPMGSRGCCRNTSSCAFSHTLPRLRYRPLFLLHRDDIVVSSTVH